MAHHSSQGTIAMISSPYYFAIDYCQEISQPSDFTRIKCIKFSAQNITISANGALHPMPETIRQ